MPERPWQQPVAIGPWSVGYPIATIIGAALYFALARLGLAFATLQESASPIWPASGFAIALLILGGIRLWPAIALGAFCANALTGGLPTAAFITIGNTLEAILGLLICARVTRISPNQLPIVRSAAFVLAALFASVASAGIGVASLVGAGALIPADAGPVAITWWAGDALGIILLCPTIIAFLRPGASDMPPVIARSPRWLRLLAIISGIAGSGGLTFHQESWSPAFLLALPVMLLAARWFGSRGLGLSVLAISSMWVISTSVGLGPFTDITLNDALLNMQIMLAAFAVTGLILVDVQYLRSVPAVIVFLAGCSIAAAIYSVQTRDSRSADERHLQNLATRIQDNITSRMGTYVNALQGGASFYAASTMVTRDDWHIYVQSLELIERYPGINGVGVVLPVDKLSAGAFIAAARRDGMPTFSIKTVPGIDPKLAAYPEHFVIIYTEPQDLNAPAVGLDLASEPKRRSAAVAARDTAKPTITERIVLVQDQSRGPGFLLFVPMYRENPKGLSAKALRSAFHGWIYAPFRAEAFFEHNMIAEAEEIELRIYDGAKADPAQLMYDNRAIAAGTDFTPELVSHLSLYGREFTLEWVRSPQFAGQPHRLAVVFCAGLVLFATLLAALIATLMTQKARADSVAADMTTALRASNERFELAAACTRDGIWDIDLASGSIWISPRYYEMFGYEQPAIADIRAFWASVILQEDEIRSREQFHEMMSGQRDDIDLIQRYRHRDGRIVHVHSRGISLKDEAGKVVRVIGVHTDISELVRLEGQFKAAISVMRDGFGLFDADDRLILFNEGFIDEGTRKAIGDPTGHTFEEIVRAFVEHDMPDAKDPAFDREAWISRRMERHREPPTDPIEVKWSGDRWMRISERRTSDGGYVGIWSDVTEIKRLGQRLQDAINSMSDGFALFDAEDRLVICNEAFIHSPSLRSAGDLVGQRMLDMITRFAHGDPTDIRAKKDPDAWIAERMQRHLNPQLEPYEQVLTDGRVLHINERRTSDGGIVGIWSDVTRLRVAERRLHDAVDNINEGFVLLDKDLRYVLFNDEFLRLYPRMAPHVAVGARFQDALRAGAEAGEYPAIDTPEKINAFIAEWEARYRDPAAFQREGAFADGRWVLIGHHGTSDGGCVNVYTDITPLKQREADLAAAKGRLEKQAEQLIGLTEDLRNARQAAEASNVSKSNFLANMSHELRTPLNAILGFSEIIKEGMFGAVAPPQYREYAEDIYNSGSHLLALINDILDLSKIEADRMELHIAPLESTSLVAQAVRLVEGLARERNVRLDADDIHDCPVIHADERQARQILLNLLSNAIKFTPDGGIVTLSLLDEGGLGAAIKVSDTGIGMTPAEIKRAMERFGQAEPSYSKTTPGTGLGLPLVDGLVKLHGGSLSIESEKGVGTTVTVRLPWHADLYHPKRKAEPAVGNA